MGIRDLQSLQHLIPRLFAELPPWSWVWRLAGAQGGSHHPQHRILTAGPRVGGEGAILQAGQQVEGAVSQAEHGLQAGAPAGCQALRARVHAAVKQDAAGRGGDSLSPPALLARGLQPPAPPPTSSACLPLCGQATVQTSPWAGVRARGKQGSLGTAQLGGWENGFQGHI